MQKVAGTSTPSPQRPPCSQVDGHSKEDPECAVTNWACPEYATCKALKESQLFL
jgi:hypothetical protein